jgi:hypothetical protein
MAFTNGTLYGQYDASFAGDVTNTAFSTCNTTNPNLQPKNDLFQILGPGGAVLLRVASSGTVTTNVAAGVATSATVIAQVQMTAPQFASLPAVPSASQICQAAFPINFNGQQLDLFQIANFSADINSSAGGAVVYRLTYNGVAATS